MIEKPQIYRATKSQGDPNDLITLAVMVGQYWERASSRGAISCLLVLPSEWKGQVPKQIHEKRILGALSGQELSRVPGRSELAASKRHNVIDAVGLGLWKLGRLERGGV